MISIIAGFIYKGGIFMWPLMFTGLLAFYIISSKTLVLIGHIGHSKQKRELIAAVGNKLSSGDFESAVTMVKSNNPVEKILEEGIHLLKNKFDQKAIEHNLETIYENESHQLEKGMPTLMILGELMPMLGLLGTVSGMIHIFHGLSLSGIDNGQFVSKGISEALINTETGLAFAIPSLFFYVLLNTQIDKQMKLMREAGAKIISSYHQLKKHNGNV